MEQNRNRYEVHLANTEELYVRTGSFLRHPESQLVWPKLWRLPIFRFLNQLFFFFKIKGDSFVLTTPYPEACISEITIAKGEALIIKPGHVLGFSSNTFLKRAWRFDLTAFLTGQFSYFYITGPCRVLYFGLGELAQDSIENEVENYDRGCVVAWSSNLSQGIATKSSMASSFLGQEDVLLDCFKGKGTLLTQTSTTGKLSKHFNAGSHKNTFTDYINVILGLVGIRI